MYFTHLPNSHQDQQFYLFFLQRNKLVYADEEDHAQLQEIQKKLQRLFQTLNASL